MRKISFTIIVLSLILAGPAVYAEDAVEAVVKEGVKEGLKGAFNEIERQTIKKYFKDNEYVRYVEEDDDKSHSHKGKGKNKSKGKNKGLPPGIAMNLERGKPIPPGIAKRDLPQDLNYALPNRHDGYERTVVGNDVVLVEIDTGKIADIITDAVLGI